MGMLGRLASAMSRKAAVPAVQVPVNAHRGGWFPILEPFTGAWQRNIVEEGDHQLGFPAVWTCLTLIAGDISKLRIKLIERSADDIWIETTNPAYSPVLRDPNPFQNSQQFIESWVLSKLMAGNAYILKERDQRNVVTNLRVLDPSRVRPLIADDGSVFYDLNADNLAGVGQRLIVPAREIIHDRWNCFFHPLVGLPPLFAHLAASPGMQILQNSARFFRNAANFSGLLIAPGTLDESTIDRLEAWYNEFSGANSGKIAAVGDNLKFQPLTMTAIDAQLAEQLRLSGENVCAIFHVPNYKAGLGTVPSTTGSGIEQLNLEYYSQCLQRLIENFELCLDEGLGLGADIGVELDLDGLIRLDALTKVQTLGAAVEKSIMSINEARKKMDLPPVAGGEEPLSQQQYWSLSALSKRALPPSQEAPTPGPGGTGSLAPPSLEPSAAQATAAMFDLFETVTRQSPIPARADDEPTEAWANMAMVEILRGFR